MKRSNNPVEKISEQVARLEARERRRQRRRWLLAGLSVCLLALGGASMVRPTQRHPNPRRLVAADTLTTQRVVYLFRESKAPLVIFHRGQDTVTISNLYEYEVYTQRQRAEQAPPTPPEAPMPTFEVSVRGKRQVGQPLTYRVEPFDPAYQLVLDFGNGITRPVEQAETRYRYPLPGHFDMHLRLVEGDSSVILQTVKYEILPQAPDEVTLETTAPADQLTLAVEPVAARPFEGLSTWR